MPIYEYLCNECGHQLEALQKIGDEPLKFCPACDNESLKKKISAPGFRLSGSGWYETDFKSKNQKNIAKGDSAESASPAKSDGAAKSEKPKAKGKEAAA